MLKVKEAFLFMSIIDSVCLRDLALLPFSKFPFMTEEEEEASRRGRKKRTLVVTPLGSLNIDLSKEAAGALYPLIKDLPKILPKNGTKLVIDVSTVQHSTHTHNLFALSIYVLHVSSYIYTCTPGLSSISINGNGGKRTRRYS